jgi:membrane protein
MLKRIRSFANLLWQAFNLLKTSNPLILASATAFFTTFSLSPILIILINVLSFYFSGKLIVSSLFEKIRNTFGRESSELIENIVDNIAISERHWMVTIFGFVFLFFVASTWMKVVNDAINSLWKFKLNQGHFLKYNAVERSKGGILILFTGVLLIASLLLDTSLSLINNYFRDLVPAFQSKLVIALNFAFSLAVVTSWFTLLLKLLPDAKVHWKVAFSGGFVTAILFQVGKLILGRLLIYGAFASIFGASASFALILLFIFYSSLIFYYGAAFTYVYATSIGKPILPGKYAFRYEDRKIE